MQINDNGIILYYLEVKGIKAELTKVKIPV